MLDGEGTRLPGSSGTPRVLELFGLLEADKGEMFGLLLKLRELPPVQSLVRGAAGLAALPVRATPTFVAASSAPLSAPVYVLAWGLGFTGGLEKARAAPRRAASRTLYCVSPVACGTTAWLRAELIECPSDWQEQNARRY